jgi:hypothetical protein
MCSELIEQFHTEMSQQVDLNLFKVQREAADPISSMDAGIVHSLNTHVRAMSTHPSHCRSSFYLIF